MGEHYVCRQIEGQKFHLSCYANISYRRDAKVKDTSGMEFIRVLVKWISVRLST